MLGPTEAQLELGMDFQPRGPIELFAIAIFPVVDVVLRRWRESWRVLSGALNMPRRFANHSTSIRDETNNGITMVFLQATRGARKRKANRSLVGVG